jgi:hypothetical protein
MAAINDKAFCIYCGKNISINAKFCDGCGEKTELQIEPAAITDTSKIDGENELNVYPISESFINSPLFGELIQKNIDYYRTRALRAVRFFEQAPIFFRRGYFERLKDARSINEEAAKSGFNWAAFFLGSIWLGYRNVPKIAYTLMAVEIFSQIYIDHRFDHPLAQLLLHVIVMILLGRYGNALYFQGIDSKLRTAKVKSVNELRDIGGVSWIHPIVIFVSWTMINISVYR